MNYQPIPWMVYHLYFIGTKIIPRTNTGQGRFNITAGRTNTAQGRFNIAAGQMNTGQALFNIYTERTHTGQTRFVIRESLRVTN